MLVVMIHFRPGNPCSSGGFLYDPEFPEGGFIFSTIQETTTPYDVSLNKGVRRLDDSVSLDLGKSWGRSL